MKKIVLLAGLYLLATSCVISEKDHDWTIYTRLSGMANTFYEISLGDAVLAMEQAAKIQEYMDASEQERKDIKFSGVGYYATENCYKIGDYYEVIPGSSGLFEKDSEWTIKQYYQASVYKAVCIKDSTWAVTKVKDEDAEAHKYYYYSVNPDKIDFMSEIHMTAGDSSGYHSWETSTEGKYIEDSTYSATFKTADTFTYKWNVSSSGGSNVYWSLTGIGTFETAYYINGTQKDWCKIKFKSDGFHEIRTSRSN